MQYIDGERFSSASEYADALEDKKIIESIKSRCNLETADGIKKAYYEVREVSFKSVIGDKFDDYVFDLYERVKNQQPSDTKENRKQKKIETNKKEKQKKNHEPMDNDMKKAVVREIKRQNRNRTVFVTALLLVAFSSIGYFIKYYSDARAVQKDSESYQELKDDKYADVLKNVTQVIKKDYTEEVVIPDILDEYLALYNKNKSLIGWIKIADTIIDYPVMQTTDNEYYLKHNFNQENDANGCIFMDYNCDVILGNDNWILYGHHMKNGKMFSILQNYANKDYYEKHKLIQFDTIYEKGTYEVMYIFRSRIYNADEIVFKYYQFIDANSKEEFDSYMEEMDAMSIIDTNVTAEYGDKLLTLSTCDYQESNGRFVVVAKKIN